MAEGYTITRSIAMNMVDHGAIVVVKGDSIGSIFRIRDDVEITLGRNPMLCDRVIYGEEISRLHCSVTYQSKTRKYRVVDHSTNGCFLNGRIRMEKEKPYFLESGTEIRLGGDDNIIKLG